ncbi:MAG: DUF349 domain-containing protein [Prevotellaceae bacterium]|nr:DUF349 domain-containing protein [Prevotellaceae bacterium]
METGEKDKIIENGENIQEEENTVFEEPQIESYSPEDREKEDAVLEEPQTEPYSPEDREKEDAVLEEPQTEPYSPEDREEEDTVLEEPQTEPCSPEDREEEDTVLEEPQTEPYSPEDREEEDTVFEEPQIEPYYPEELNLGEETAMESEISVAKNYFLLSPQNLLDELKTLVDNFPVERIKKDVEAIRDAFYKDRHDFSENDDNEDDDESGESESGNAVDPVEKEFDEYLEKYREKKAEYTRIAENRKEENYRQKLAIIEELKELIKEEEDLNLTFQKFHDIQNRWKEIAQVPQAHIKDLWDTWHYNVEKFYDYVKINRELRDLDLRRNLEAKNELVRKAEALLESPLVLEAFTQLQQYHDAWREIGPVPREHRERIWERFKDASYKLNKKHQAYFEQMKQERQHNIQMKYDLCERVEKLNSRELKSMKEWQKASDELSNILDEWKAIGFVPKRENSEVYSRLKRSRDDFFSKRRVYYKSQKQETTVNFRLKKALCEQAKAIRDNDTWEETTEMFIELQRQWKLIGPVPRKYSGSLWNEFRESCDIFFNRKFKQFSKKGIKEQYASNLKEKEALIAELENFEPGGNDSKTIDTLKQFRQRWNNIGFVPFKEKDKVQIQFFAILDEKYKQLKISDAQRKVVRMKDKMEASRNRPPNRIVVDERERLFSRIMQLENEINLLDNNIGFFASSKNADSMIADVRRKISKTKEEIHKLEEQIKLIDKEFE